MNFVMSSSKMKSVKVLLLTLLLIPTVCLSDAGNKSDLGTSLGGYTLGQACENNTIEDDGSSLYVAVGCTDVTKVIAIITILFTEQSYEEIRDHTVNRFGPPYSENNKSAVWSTLEKTVGCAT